MKDKFRDIVEFLGLKRSIAGLLTMVILVGLGEKMAERFLPLYIIALGASPLIPGLLNGMDNLLSALYSYPGGWLTEKIGYKRALAVFNLVAMTGFLIVIIVPHWVAVVIGSVFFLSWTALSLPATMELVSAVLPKNKRTMGVSVHSLVRRIPMALGPVLGGILIDIYGVKTGIRLSFVTAFVLGAVSLIIQQWMIEEKHEKKDVAPSSFLENIAAMPRELKSLLVSDILIRFCEQIPYAYLAIWAMYSAGGAKISGTEFGILTAVEMTVALLIYVPVAYFADKGEKKPFVLITFLNFAIFPVVLYFSTSFRMLVIAFIVRGLKEFGEPTRKALIMDLAPEGKKASTFGSYYLLRDTVVSIAAFASAWLWQISPAVNFFTAAFFGFAGTVLFAVKGRGVERSMN